MATTEAKVRIRPNKVAILISKTAAYGDLALAVRFLSRIWGGRHCPILPVNPSGDDPRAIRWLAQVRPDFIYTLGVDDTYWRDVGSRVCQQRVCESLTQQAVETIHRPEFVGLTTIIPILRKRRMQPSLPRNRRLRFVYVEEGSVLTPYATVVFGDSDPVWGGDALYLPETDPPKLINLQHSAADIVRIATDYMTASHLSWLDLGSEGLSTILQCMHTPPTIVAVRSAADLALAWNLRTSGGDHTPVWVIPLPVDSLSEQPVLDALKEWMVAVKKFGQTPNFCEIASLTVPDSELQDFAQGLQECLAAEGIQYVDVVAPHEEIPKLHFYDSDETVSVELTGRALTMAALRPSLSDHMQQTESWVVELVRDERTGRALAELCLPPRLCVQELLNIPEPPSLPTVASVPNFSFADSSISVHCTKRDDIIRLCLPSAEEILEEVLYESGITPIEDEKCAAYTPAFAILGGLTKAAHNFKRRLRQVIRVLRVHGTATLPTIQAEAKLGNGKLPDELSEPRHVQDFLRGYAAVVRRVSLKRFKEYWQDYYPDDTKLKSLLEHWLSLGLLVQKAGGYALEPRVDKAVREGLIPVALTGDFLRRLTLEGFLWVPGIKYQRGATLGDIDVIAVCDGALVVGECKEMEGVPKSCEDWEASVWPKFEELIETAKACRADIVLLASLADSYPDGWKDRARAKAGDSMSVLLLTREDLDAGHRRLPKTDVMPERQMFIRDIVRNPRKARVRRDPPGARTVSIGGWVAQYGC
jgi:hypothetical protein